MSKLIYSAIVSLDGYVEDASGGFEWAAPDEEVHTFANELDRPVGTYLYGRRMYETMLYWATAHLERDQPSWIQEFTRIWQLADKIVYSWTLTGVASANTQLVSVFDPEAVRQLKATATHDLTVGGAGLAAQALAAGLVDELQMLVVPVIVGGGKSWLPGDVHLQLELLESRRFRSGTVFAKYRTAV